MSTKLTCPGCGSPDSLSWDWSGTRDLAPTKGYSCRNCGTKFELRMTEGPSEAWYIRMNLLVQDITGKTGKGLHHGD